jgi:hypothetical protein
MPVMFPAAAKLLALRNHKTGIDERQFNSPTVTLELRKCVAINYRLA